MVHAKQQCSNEPPAGLRLDKSEGLTDKPLCIQVVESKWHEPDQSGMSLQAMVLRLPKLTFDCTEIFIGKLPSVSHIQNLVVLYSILWSILHVRC